jgi:TolB protein
VRADGAGHRQIFFSDLLGQDVTQLTSDRADSIDPHWSPDGAKLLYTGYYKSGFPDIILLDVAGRTRRTFAGFKGTNTGGAFSPDGGQVAMILSSSGNSDLYVSDAEGKNIRRLTNSSAGENSQSSPTWSPQGTRLIVASDPRGYPLLFPISATANNLRKLPSNLPTTDISYYCAEPAWNPRDEDKVAFRAGPGTPSAPPVIAVFSFKDDKATKYVDGSEPCWASDGRHIIYTRHVSGKPDQLWIVDTITRKYVELTTRGAAEASFVYPKQ